MRVSSGPGFGGLARSTKSASTYLDGQHPHGNWWYGTFFVGGRSWHLPLVEDKLITHPENVTTNRCAFSPRDMMVALARKRRESLLLF
jgi:hypothetical protein